ncbi:MAG: hypothetical protein IPN15_15985 [Saprospiraceae bacterium]|nr:hypothetical protein [Candidatus Vicinibacter affinis]
MKNLYLNDRKRAAANTGLVKVAVPFSADSFVINHPAAGGLGINTYLLADRFVVKIATFAKPENRYASFPHFSKRK